MLSSAIDVLAQNLAIVSIYRYFPYFPYGAKKNANGKVNEL